MKIITHLFSYIFLLILSSETVFAGKFIADVEIPHPNTAQKAILITGATSGIGRNMAETLAAKGYFVYAGARKDKDIKALNKIKNIQAIRLDVTIQSDIDRAVETITKEGRGLYGLVNNAGVTVFGPLIEVSEKDMQFQMDVNLFGPYRVTKAFAPLIIQSKGRIVTIGSIAGIFSGPMIGPYNMSKFAMEAFNDVLAAEMKKFDVQVSIIEPGNYNSKVIKNMLDRQKRRGQSDQNSLYAKEMANLGKYFGADRTMHKSPAEVSNAVVHALFDKSPKPRYMVVPNQREANITITQAIKKVVQLNHNQTYSYSREDLISMLEQALKSEP